MKRKLASIQKVLTVEPIPNADRIEKITVLGWQLIANKGQFKPRDLCVFFEIDSIVPERPEYEFLRPRKFRVKTLRSNRLGVISQGLAMRLDETMTTKFMQENVWIGGKSIKDIYNDMVGMDVTELLGVQKYEIPIEGGKGTKPKGAFPTHLVPRTDELRIQSFPQLLEEMKGLPFEARIKYDGTSFTCYSYNGEGGVCSRNLELQETDTDVYWKVAHNYDLPKRLNKYCKLIGKNFAIQGEICGPIVIHGGRNPTNSRTDDLFGFSVYDIDEHKYMDNCVAESIFKDLGIKFVELKFEGESFNYTIPELEELAKGKYPNTQNNIEGIVIRPKKYKYSPTIGGQLSFKVINTDYLLEE